MPKLLYTWYFEKITASVTSSGHSALRHKASRICTILFLTKMIYSFFKKKLVSSRGAPQESDAKYRFAIHPQGIRQFHDNCKIAKCRTVATLASVYIYI